MLISLTVGKVDAGVAVLLTEDKRLVSHTSCRYATPRHFPYPSLFQSPIDIPAQIEFPSILLPPSISSGSIVDITVSRNYASEAAAHKSFQALQSSILATYGQRSPTPPLLRCRNATQTSVVLEWDPIELATADLRSLSLYRNGSKAGSIPRPLEITATKISGLAVDTEYVFYLVLKTSAGHYSSEKLAVRTHKMTDLSGITVTPGVLPAPLRESLSAAVRRIGAKLADSVRIDTTHFVCTEGRGREWEKALEMNIPVVRPEWVEGCEREGRVMGVRSYYLNADPRLRQVGPGISQQQQSILLQQQVAPRDRPERQPSPQRTPIQAASTTSDTSVTPNSDEHAPPPPAKDTPQNSYRAATATSDDEADDPATPSPKEQGAPTSRNGLGVLSPQPGGSDEEGRKSPGDQASFSEVQL